MQNDCQETVIINICSTSNNKIKLAYLVDTITKFFTQLLYSRCLTPSSTMKSDYSFVYFISKRINCVSTFLEK